MCKGKAQVKALFARSGGNVPTTLDNAQAFGSLFDIHVPNLVNNKSLSSFDNSFIVGP
jgi:hypothetical protein